MRTKQITMVYILDTNVVSVLYDAGRPNHELVQKAIADLGPEAPQLISVVTIAELRYGLELSLHSGRSMAHVTACIREAEEHPLAEIGRHTGYHYALVKSGVAVQRVDIRRRVPRWVEEWTDRVTGRSLQVDENDLWIAAQGLERDLVVVTSDRDFARVIVPALQELRVKLVP